MASSTLHDVLKTPHTFNDGIRSIDYVLVWEAEDKDSTSHDAFDQRMTFENTLQSEGLELEHEVNGLLHFIKIHAPVAVLRRYADILKLRMPMKYSASLDDKNSSCSFWDSPFMTKFAVNTDFFPKKPPRLTAIYSIDKEYLFDTTSEEFWTPSVRFRVVQFILDRQKHKYGIVRLISKGIYSAAYPLHDGHLNTVRSMRYALNKNWASVKKWYKFQPLDALKDYFGVKISLYFSWLGFYTIMLLPASLVGFICSLYSAATVLSDIPSNEICEYNSTIRLCPSCDECDYVDLRETCSKSRGTYLVDNPSTLFLAVFMSLWAACFLEFWKRYSAEITHRWDLTGFDIHHEHPRPQYLTQLAHVKTQLNIITGEEEPKVPFWRMRVPATIMSYGIVCLLVLVVITSVLGVILYRISKVGASFIRDNNTAGVPVDSKLFTSVTAALINLLFIIVFGKIYEGLATWLTEKELLRTQTEFDNSLTLKIYLLQFVNYYSSIVYIAFFKGKFIGYPGHYQKLFGIRQEECNAGGCLAELSIQLAIVMIGKQVLNAVKEMATAYVTLWWNKLRKKKQLTSSLQWVSDYTLVDFEKEGLFPEYLEMVLQFGFITIFVSAFPLAPLFALLNNVLEIRFDAKKFIQCYRRTVPQRINDIGVWYRILDTIGKLSIITNALIIAFTSDFIPRLVYASEHGNLENYVEFTLTKYNVSILEAPPKVTTYNGTQCSFPNYSYYKPNSSDHERVEWYWHVMYARFAFVLMFQNVVSLTMIILRWAITDMPSALRNQIQRESYVTNKIIQEQTLERSQIERDGASEPNGIRNLTELLLR